MKNKPRQFDIAALRADLRESNGKRYWRSLEELAETPEFREYVEREFPEGATEWDNSVSRRGFLKLMGASLALAGVSGCVRQPIEKIAPYTKPPEEIVPGKPLHYATAIPLDGYATGVLVESTMGRPTKIEGNPQHPASLGATDVFAQASILTLYDPDRSQVVLSMGEISTWQAFLASVNPALALQRVRKGSGFRILTGTVTSPTLARQIQALLTLFPKAKWHQYDPAGRDAVREGARLAFGEFVETRYLFDKADVVVSLDADFLSSMPGSVRYAHDFMDRRSVRSDRASMNRLYAVESMPTITGAMADHRLALRPSEIVNFAQALAGGIGVPGISSSAKMGGGEVQSRWIHAIAKDLREHHGSSLIVPGDQQPAAVHALAHAMNAALGNVGKTLVYTASVEASPTNQTDTLRELVADMDAGRVELLAILGGNPVYDAPADLHFGTKLANVAMRVHLGLYPNETAEQCHWHIPEAHHLETWGDTRAFDGTVSLLQPLIAPLYGGKSSQELVSTLAGKSGLSSYEIVQDYWRSRYGKPGGLPAAKDFDVAWQTALCDGIVAGTALPSKPVRLRPGWESGTALMNSQEPSSLDIIFRPDPTIWDGTFINNGWLQELPKPLTKLTWDNAALISPSTAEQLQLANEDVVELHHRGRKVEAPVWIVPGHAPDCVTVHLGYGQSKSGNVGTGTGFSAYALRASDAPWADGGLEIRKTRKRFKLACTQEHNSMEGRNLIRTGTLREFVQHPDFVREMDEVESPIPSMYPGFKYESYAWGMSIDLNACIGCNACTIACQSENNIPVVGKTQVARGREMHWIRIDRYFSEDLDNPEILQQPVLCMHCENAPCEPVCPVGATMHSQEGLNEMVYNRCVGTRYCSNNCPYKVRRFNFLQYSDQDTPSLQMLANPNVTVRTRGVMEKCTYCVQRIQAAKIEAEKENRLVRDGEIVTACQQVCPTGAIVFGDINNADSRVAKLKKEPHDYGMLTELNTRPRTTYLAKLRNPNPELEGSDR